MKEFKEPRITTATQGFLWDACPTELSQPPRMRISRSWTRSVVPVVIPSSGECPESFSKMAFIGIGIRRGIQYACEAHQSTSKGYSYRKQILSIDNN